MKRREPVSHIMTKNVSSVTTDHLVKDVVEMAKNNHIRHIPVLKSEKVVGIISSTDLSKLDFSQLFDNQSGANENIYASLSIEKIMHPNPLTVNADDAIRDVAEIFANANFHALPVLENDKLVGMVSTTDVIKYMLSQY